MKRSAGTEETKEGKRKSKKGKGPAALEGVSPADIEKHQKQLMAELRTKTVNKEAVEKLQVLSFESRTEDIASNFQGSDVVKSVCKKYPFLQLEQQVMFVERMYLVAIVVFAFPLGFSSNLSGLDKFFRKRCQQLEGIPICSNSHQVLQKFYVTCNLTILVAVAFLGCSPTSPLLPGTLHMCLMFVQLFAFCFKILCELRLHVGKVSGEELAPGIEIFEENWRRLLPYLCENETPEGN